MPVYLTSQSKALEYYKIYLSIRLHFTNKDYDIKEYGGKVRFDEDKFYASSSYITFKKLIKEYNSFAKFKEIMVSNVLVDSKVRPEFLLTEDAKKIHAKWIARTDFLMYNLEQDIKKLSEHSIIDVFKTDGTNPPLLLKKYIDGTICLETLVILYRFTKIKKIYSEALKNCFIYQDICLLIKKYSVLLNYDIIKMKQFVSKLLGDWLQNQSTLD